ncbi:MAG: substrate-binding domain-containing protein, partial [Anaerolineae bacterium]|nr:substrate-binding domain-containing protein [Anaerolineae bacterium]
LRTQHTQMIAIMIADISNAFYHPIVRSVQDVARQHDYDVLITNSDHVYENEMHFCEAVMRRPVDGIIMVPIHLTYEDIDRLLTLSGSPVVALGDHVNHPLVDVVHMDDQQATYDAVRWLAQTRGYRRIGCIAVPDTMPPGPRRLQGFRQGLADCGLPFELSHVLMGDFSIDGGRRAAEQLMAQGEMPEVLLAFNDLMAIGAILTFLDAGLNVPGDIAVMGFDNIGEATIIRPRLTTIAQQPEDIGHKLATALFERIEGKVEGPRRFMNSPYSIIPRESA